MSKRQQPAQSVPAATSRATIIKDFLSVRLREGLVILISTMALFILLSLSTYHTTDPGWSHTSNALKIANAGGRVGAWVADFLLFFCGAWGYLLPFLLAYSAVLTYHHRFENIHPWEVRLALVGIRLLGFVLLTLAATGLINLYWPKASPHLPNHAGGLLGQVVINNITHNLNFYGGVLILIASTLIGITLLTGLSWLTLSKILIRKFSQAAHCLQQLLTKIARLKLNFKTKNSPVLSTTKIEPGLMANDVKVIDSGNGKKSITVSLPKLIKYKPGIETRSYSKENKKSQAINKEASNSTELPELSLLSVNEPTQKVGLSAEILEERSREVESRLADFGIMVQVTAVYPGPVVTRFEVQLAAGTKVSRISSLAKDLARSLSVVSVRIVEVIPGKSVIGIELPNDHREMVGLQEVLASKAYHNSHSVLSLALGKDIAGNAVVVDLAKMPHLLVAGTTGAGKSVSLNVMLLSLLYKATPEQLRLIMIDPKMLELAVYDGIPHLLTPVVTDMKDAASALRWCVVEMERRYRLMANLGVRNITGYNAKVNEAAAKGAPLFDPVKNPEHEQQQPLQALPMIVVLADEFADMMVVVGKKVETLIARLAQKARAAGIHLILATQRPSVDVITGLIKANIPTRIAFQVSSKIDSRTILDQQGAEQLLGNGDMLYLAPGTGVPLRVHGAYVSDEDVHKVVNYLKMQGQPQYLDEILTEGTQTDATYNENLLADGDSEQDPFYDEAVHMVTKARKVSVSSIQRRFKIGYNRAARIVEAMETAGVVSKMEANGVREVLVPTSVE